MSYPNETAGRTDELSLTQKYIFGRLKKLAPMYFLSYILLLLYVIFVEKKSIFKILYGCVFELSMLQSVGLPWALNGHLWYVSALILVSGPIFFCLLKNEDRFIIGYAPFIVLIIYTGFYRYIGHLDVGLSWNFLVCDGVWRAIAGLCLGCIVYRLSEQARKKWIVPDQKIRGIVSITEIILLGSILAICYYSCRQIDFLAVILIAAFIFCLTWGCSFQSTIMSNRISDFLGKISYPMYINQMLFLKITISYFSDFPFRIVVFWYIVVNVLFAILQTAFFEYINNMWRNTHKTA